VTSRPSSAGPMRHAPNNQICMTFTIMEYQSLAAQIGGSGACACLGTLSRSVTAVWMSSQRPADQEDVPACRHALGHCKPLYLVARELEP
jgi:hypothetical protein